MEDDYDLIFKIILIGDSGVGKSQILSRYLTDEFKIQTKATVGVEFGSKKIELKGTKIKAQIWDTAGQERYKSITNAYYKGSKGALIVYDVSRKETFVSVDKWIAELKMSAEPDVNIILVGNKCDLRSEREVTTEDGEKKAGQYGIAFLETSAMLKINIEKAFVTMVGEIFKKYEKIYGEENEDYLDIHHNAVNLNSGGVGNNKSKKKNFKDCCK